MKNYTPTQTLTIKTANLYTQNKCTGNCADIDFSRQGYIDITFGLYHNRITAIDYCGVSFNMNRSTFWLNPFPSSVKSNQAFYDRLIAPLEESEQKTKLLSLINSK